MARKTREFVALEEIQKVGVSSQTLSMLHFHIHSSPLSHHLSIVQQRLIKVITHGLQVSRCADRNV